MRPHGRSERWNDIAIPRHTTTGEQAVAVLCGALLVAVLLLAALDSALAVPALALGLVQGAVLAALLRTARARQRLDRPVADEATRGIAELETWLTSGRPT
jgi:cobalamin synthase